MSLRFDHPGGIESHLRQLTIGNPSMDPGEYVQRVVVRRSGTHEDAVHAVAEASLRAYVKTAGDPDLGPKWVSWLGSAFVKSVRRPRPREFANLRPSAQAYVRHNDAAALGFAPMRYADLPPAIAKLQVSGTDLPRAGWPDVEARIIDAGIIDAGMADAGIVVAINEGLGMTTGKAAAQAAHGVFATYLKMGAPERRQWAGAAFAFRVIGVPAPRFRGLRERAVGSIADAGRTEIEAGTATVVVLGYLG